MSLRSARGRKNMKNIAILVPTLNKGGAERVAANMSLEFAKHYNVYLIVHDGRNPVYPHGGRLIDLQLPPAGNKLGKLLVFVKRIRALRRLKRQYQIDVTISHLPASNNANIFSRAGDRVITYVHCMETWSPVLAVREWVTAKLSDRMICVSECVRRCMTETFHIDASKTATVYNFCDLKAPEAAGTDSRPLTISTMGRLTEQKGQWHLIRALRKIADHAGEAIRLKIIGEGELREPLTRLAEKLGLGDQVEFTGFLEDPWSVLADTEIYVSSSLYEGLPMALVEAGRCGLPIVATDCDAGCREILAPGTEITEKTTGIEKADYGVLVPVCSTGSMEQTELTAEEELMADAVLELIRDPELRHAYARRAEERSEDFRAEAIMKQWFEILE